MCLSKRQGSTDNKFIPLIPGSLMVIAWIGFASVGIFMARYKKGAFDEKELLGTKVWFTVRGLRFFWMF